MAIPAWKLALLEKKKKQEEEAKVKEAQAEEAKLASLPAWKRAIALREKQAKDAPQGGTANHSITPPTKRSNKWQVAVERVKGPDSPILPKWKGASSSPAREVVANPVIASSNKFAGFSKPEVFTGSPKPGRPAQLAGSAMSPKPGRSAGSSKPELVFAGHPKPAAKIAANTTTKTENKVAQRWTHKNSSSSSASAAPLSKASPAGPPITGDDDPSLAAMPAWKRALLLKKRQQQQKPVEDSSITSKHNGGEDEPDSAAPASTPSVPTPSAPKAHQPEVVNKRVDTGDVEAPSNRLVEQEGKTLRAPVYKEVDEWANVKEEDDKFQSLPPWKQALIKRRRVDIAKRSGLPVPESPTPPTAQGVSSPLTKKAAFEKKSNSRSSNSPKKPAKTVNEQKGKVGRRDLSRNRTKNESPTPTKAVDSKPVKKAPVHKKSEDLKPARKAPQPPPAKDPMFTYNFSKSKSTHHTLDTGGTSSDSTDSELEDAVVTNLDESSDEGDSGIVLQRYTPSKPSSSSPNIGQKSPSLGQKSHSDTSVDTPSVLSKPGKKKRGVSPCC